MTIILTSRLETHVRDENGTKTSIPIEDKNEILTNIKKYLKGNKRLVYVANNPKNIEENDIRIVPVFESFDKTGLYFDEKILLDCRNIKQAKEILTDADLIILSGGKCLCQLKFFKKIKLKKILQNYQGLVIGISAGTMNLCKIVANFPEEKADLKEKRWLKGLGFFDEIIIPHFDGETNTYQIECDEVDLVNDYVLPMSHKHKFIGLPNESYVLIDNDLNVKYYGVSYEISNGEVKRRENQ